MCLGKQRREAIEVFYRKLFCRPEVRDTPPVWWKEQVHSALRTEEILAEFTEEEVAGALEAARRTSAPGESGISAIMLQKLGKTAVKIVTQCANEWRKTGKLPEEWRVSMMCMIFKSGDQADLGNYRPICLQEVAYKVMTTIIMKRMDRALEGAKAWAEVQNGFRRGRGTSDHLVSMVLAEKWQRRIGAKQFMAFIDIKKAYDSVPPEVVYATLRLYGMDDVGAQRIAQLQMQTVMKILVDGRLTEAIPVQIGLKQGDPLSPLLFNLVLNPILTHWARENRGFQVGTRRMNALAYADDLLLRARSWEEMVMMIDELRDFGEWSNLRLSAAKCVIWAPNGVEGMADGIPAEYQGIKVSREKGKYKYLGVWAQQDGGWETQMDAVERRMQELLAWTSKRALSVQQKVWVANAVMTGYVAYGAQAVVPPLAVRRSWDGQVAKAVLRGISPSYKKGLDLLVLPPEEGGAGLRRVSDVIVATAIVSVSRWMDRHTRKKGDWGEIAMAMAPERKVTGGGTGDAWLQWDCRPHDSIEQTQMEWVRGEFPISLRQTRAKTWEELKEEVGGRDRFGAWDKVVKRWPAPAMLWGTLEIMDMPEPCVPEYMKRRVEEVRICCTRQGIQRTWGGKAAVPWVRLGPVYNGVVNGGAGAEERMIFTDVGSWEVPETGEVVWGGAVYDPGELMVYSAKVAGCFSSGQGEMRTFEEALLRCRKSHKVTFVTDSMTIVKAWKEGMDCRDSLYIDWKRIVRAKEEWGGGGEGIEVRHIYSHQKEKMEQWIRKGKVEQIARMEAENKEWGSRYWEARRGNEEADRLAGEACHGMDVWERDPSMDNYVMIAPQGGLVIPVGVMRLVKAKLEKEKLEKGLVEKVKCRNWKAVAEEVCCSPDGRRAWWRWRLKRGRTRANARRTFCNATWRVLAPASQAFWADETCWRCSGGECDTQLHRVLECPGLDAWRRGAVRVMNELCKGHWATLQEAAMQLGGGDLDRFLRGNWVRVGDLQCEDAGWSWWARTIPMVLDRWEKEDWKEVKRRQGGEKRYELLVGGEWSVRRERTRVMWGASDNGHGRKRKSAGKEKAGEKQGEKSAGERGSELGPMGDAEVLGGWA